MDLRLVGGGVDVEVDALPNTRAGKVFGDAVLDHSAEILRLAEVSLLHAVQPVALPFLFPPTLPTCPPLSLFLLASVFTPQDVVTTRATATLSIVPRIHSAFTPRPI